MLFFFSVLLLYIVYGHLDMLCCEPNWNSGTFPAHL